MILSRKNIWNLHIWVYVYGIRWDWVHGLSKGLITDLFAYVQVNSSFMDLYLLVYSYGSLYEFLWLMLMNTSMISRIHSDLIIRDATNNGRDAFKMHREHYILDVVSHVSW